MGIGITLKNFTANFFLCDAGLSREKYLENEIFSRSGKNQGILWMARKI